MKNKQTQLYRYYNANREILYVGISLNAVIRLSAHRQTDSWFCEISFVSVENFASRDEALQMEKQAILVEKPKYNLQHNIALQSHKGQKKDDPLLATSWQDEVNFVQRQRDKLQSLYLAAEQSNLEWRSKFYSILSTNKALIQELDDFKKSKFGKKYLKSRKKDA